MQHLRRFPIFFSLFTLIHLLGCETDPPPTTSSCGDGRVGAGEQCDDGNETSGDGCSATCTVEAASCGNGKKETGEDCDDGNTASGDGCSSTCSNEMPVCGDGKIEGFEACDDGNSTAGDGCSSICQKESLSCGDGVVGTGETCDDGNKIVGDGCENDCTTTGSEIVCQTLDPIASGTCVVTPGDTTTLVVGTVLTGSHVYRGGQVLIDAAGMITCAGCGCAGVEATATIITCPSGVISAGLINTHDHITFTQSAPYTATSERYEHRHDWRKGQNGHTSIPANGGASADQIRWGELRFLMGGATSIVGSGTATGFLRNLDRADQEGLTQDPVNFDTFPLGDSGGERLTQGCAYPGLVMASDIAQDDAYEPHVSEGIDLTARNEFLCLSSGANDVVVDKSAFIHSIGLLPNDYALMGLDGTSLIWSPRSNITLYGNTATVTAAARLGVTIGLGTDWMPTGSMNLLRELRCADELNTKYYAGFFSDRDLWTMITLNAARITATDDVIGDLRSGLVADLSIFDGAVHKDYRAIIDAEAKDVTLVMRGGKLIYGDDNIVKGALPAAMCDAIDVCGTAKVLCTQSEIGKTYAALKSSAGASIYPAFFCNAPQNEPSCVPSRSASVNGSTTYTGIASAMDADGDGIDDATDICPMVFSPIRPLDDGAQADFDADGVGDACDPCPLDVGTDQCSVYDPADLDSDGVLNTMDNCPTKQNAEQVDMDMDGKGDACDLCPKTANPGMSACPFTIYDLKNHTVAPGNLVSVKNAIVTAGAMTGFFMQTKMGDPGYAGAEYSGIYVYAPGNTVKQGDRVTVTVATLQDYFGQLQLSGATVVIDASLNEALPAPVVDVPANLATNGSLAEKLEGVLVQVADVETTNIKPDATVTNEFVVDNSLRINDLLYLATPFPHVGDTWKTITGVLDFRNGDSKIEPRSAADLVAGPPSLVAFSPATTFSRVGLMGAPTFPMPVQVVLSSAAQVDTFVTVTSGDPMSLAITGGGILVPAGATSAAILVDALLPAQNVVLTAVLGTKMQTSSVRVLDMAEAPSAVMIDPPMTTMVKGGTSPFTISLDIPAPPGGTLVNLAIAPMGAGMVPATVLVPDNAISAPFDYIDANMAPATVTITATLGAATAMATVNVVNSIGTLVINEVDYDQPGTDMAEFVEIYNGTGQTVDLTNLALVFVNGSNNTEYSRVKLAAAGSLPAGGYLVVANAAFVVMPPALKVNFSGAQDQVQNGAPDAVALVDTVALTVIDALSYEGSVTAGMVPGFGSVNFVEGMAATVADIGAGSMCRLPNGADTNVANVNWALSMTLTPGAPNMP